MLETIIDLKNRRSCRRYQDRQITEDELNTILEAGTYAPTGMGKQSPKIVVVQNRELIRKISRMNAAVMHADTDPFYGAPTLLIVFGNREIPTFVQDAALVMGNLMNAANALNVDSCYINRAKEVFESEEGRKLMKEWGISDQYVGVANCILGYRAEGGVKDAAPRKKDYIVRVD